MAVIEDCFYTFAVALLTWVELPKDDVPLPLACVVHLGKQAQHRC
jgi:hypothetical protein